uniref:CDT1 domain-containing protein n=1 Tax=Caenorhabditis tropicalis TaxID=1561998 RepID=A0A1I7T9R1_9PELO
MPVVRPNGTSVKERVAAIENKELVVVGKKIDNIVIRAKYEPEVRGVNRFRHFHTVLYENKDADNGMEKASRRKKKNVSLPQLNHGNHVRKTSKPRKVSVKLTGVPLEDRTKSKTSSESDSSLKMGYSGIRLNDALSIQHQAVGPKRTFASLGQRQNGVIINRPLKNSLEVALPPRSKSAQDLEARAESKAEISPTPTDTSFVLSTSRSSKDMATQTSRKHVSTASVEFLNVRSTQTDSVPIVINSRRKSEMPPSLQDIEEREALLEVIEDALGETFDRYSRVRTNQIIANSARKQAQIWRDVKDFLGCNLFPSAIQMANKSTSRSKTAAEIVQGIRMYP